MSLIDSALPLIQCRSISTNINMFILEFCNLYASFVLFHWVNTQIKLTNTNRSQIGILPYTRIFDLQIYDANSYYVTFSYKANV